MTTYIGRLESAYRSRLVRNVFLGLGERHDSVRGFVRGKEKKEKKEQVVSFVAVVKRGVMSSRVRAGLYWRTRGR